MKEKDAKRKYCPFFKHTTTHHNQGYGQPGPFSHYTAPSWSIATTYNFCLTTGCMMWKETWKSARKDTQEVDAEGYCTLAEKK